MELAVDNPRKPEATGRGLGPAGALLAAVLAACGAEDADSPAGDASPDVDGTQATRPDAGSGSEPITDVAIPVRGGELGNALVAFRIGSDGLVALETTLPTEARTREVARSPGGSLALLVHAQGGDDGESRAVFIAPAADDQFEIVAEVLLGDSRAPTAAAFVSDSEAVVAMRGADGDQLVTLDKQGDSWAIKAQADCDEAPSELHRIGDSSLLTVQLNSGNRRIATATRTGDGSFTIGEQAAAIGNGPAHALVHPSSDLILAASPEPDTAEDLNGQGWMHALAAEPPFASMGDPATLPYRALGMALSTDGGLLVTAHDIREWAPGGIVSVTISYALATVEIGSDSLGPVDGEITMLDAIGVTDMAFATGDTLITAYTQRDQSNSQHHLLQAWQRGESGGWTPLGDSFELDGSPAGMALLER